MHRKTVSIIALSLAIALILGINAFCQYVLARKVLENQPNKDEVPAASEKEALAPHTIPGAETKAIPQTTLKAGCETYACTMLMNILGFDLDEITFADNYLDCHYVFEDENGHKSGPDMYSGFAGTAYAGWGVYAPSMAKSMNQYLRDQGSGLKAYNYENIPLEKLCREYIANDIPVMVWATTDMQEPYVFDTWTVNYVDENARTELGDTFEWYAHEHCLVLIGYDDEEYYFDDSVAGTVSHFPKALAQQRYEQLGSQCIVVK